MFHDFLICQALEPRICGFYYTKIHQTYQKLYGNILENYYLWKSETQKFRKLWNLSTQPHSHRATQPYSHRATQPHSYIATKEAACGRLHKGGGGLRPPPLCGFPLWLCCYVALWLCGYVAMQLCGYMAMWLCGYVAMWLLVVGCWLLVVGLTLISLLVRRGKVSSNINQPVSKGIQGHHITLNSRE